MPVASWLASSMVRHFPHTASQQPGGLALDGALNEHLSFQVALRSDSSGVEQVRVEVAGPPGWSIRIRRVGYVPVAHHNTPVQVSEADVDGRYQIPGYVPDPLFDEAEIPLPPEETHAFWIGVQPAASSLPGSYAIIVKVISQATPQATHVVIVQLHDVHLADRSDFAVTHWFYVDALMDWYGTELFDDRLWHLLAPYMRDVVEHGQDTLYVPVLTPPLDGVKRPTQLLGVERTGDDTYRFDWRDVARYVDLARRCGITRFEWCHLFTQWGAAHAIRVYEGQGVGERLLWQPDTAATSQTYRAFLSQYLPELYRFLEHEGLLKVSYFHVSDEPHGDAHLRAYREARCVLRELAPWMQVMDALTDMEFARQGLTDMPIPSIQSAVDFVSEGIPCWCYYCCGPRGKYVNRLLDTPLPKIAMHGFLFYRWPFRGFLHWGYNYWYESQTRHLIDPYTTQDGLAWDRGWAYGDPFLVYPGPDGPVDSIRWEVFRESLQDYALLQALCVPRDHAFLAPILSFEDFPKTELWRRETRRRLLALDPAEM